ncbi:hypothetical protein EDD29_5511 [Actinocorallia herbida]|uniref:Uncharacterized protein n=2 Tax=Actinocorallia herbida TaxID=58109 RepID=A0A3N1D2U8_9ACTN|nr:hypothetical protein EDD29_5511 [Actinocorallia herbida]
MTEFAHNTVVEKLRDAIGAYCKSTKLRWTGDDEAPAVPDRERDAETARFLAALTIDHERIHRDHVEYAAPTMFVQPVLDKMGVSAPAAAVWKAVLDVFRSRMRGRGPVSAGELPTILQRGYTFQGFPSDLARMLSRRSITMLDIQQAIEVAVNRPIGYQQLPVLRPSSRLEVKLEAGGCSVNTLERAMSLRSDYRDYWSGRESGDPMARMERRRLERLLQRICDQTTDGPNLLGTLLWRRLEEAINSLDPSVLPAGMDPELAMGGICDLTDRCKVWFSHRFDVDAVLAADSVGEGTRS